MSVETVTYVASEMVNFVPALVVAGGVGAASITTLLSLGRGSGRGRFVKDAAYGGLCLSMIGCFVSLFGASFVEVSAKPAEFVEYVETVADVTLTHKEAYDLLRDGEVVEDGRLYEVTQAEGTETYTLTITELEPAD